MMSKAKGEITAIGMPFAASPRSSPTKVSRLSEIWPFGFPKSSSSLELPLQKPGCLRPNVWDSSWPPYQSPHDPSVSPETLIGLGSELNAVSPVGADATTLVSGLSGTPDEQPRMKPPVLITSAKYLVCGSRPAASSVARMLASCAFAWSHVNGNLFAATTEDVVKVNCAAGNARWIHDWNSVKSSGRTLWLTGPVPTPYVRPTTRICRVGVTWNVWKFALPVPMMLW